MYENRRYRCTNLARLHKPATTVEEIAALDLQTFFNTDPGKIK
jgi:hypothetical protein